MFSRYFQAVVLCLLATGGLAVAQAQPANISEEAIKKVLRNNTHISICGTADPENFTHIQIGNPVPYNPLFGAQITKTVYPVKAEYTLHCTQGNHNMHYGEVQDLQVVVQGTFYLYRDPFNELQVANTFDDPDSNEAPKDVLCGAQRLAYLTYDSAGNVTKRREDPNKPVERCLVRMGAKKVTASTPSQTSSTVKPHALPVGNENASIPTQNDPATFDIVGLKLGMTAKEAAATLATRFPSLPVPALHQVASHFNHTETYTIVESFKGDNFHISFQFAESYPRDPEKPEQLMVIDYTAVSPSQADKDRFQQMVYSKYGDPAYGKNSRYGGKDWCKIGSSAGSAGYFCAHDFPILTLNGIRLILKDDGMEKRIRKLNPNAPPL